VGELDTSKATDVGSLEGFLVNTSPNEYGDAGAAAQHWKYKTGDWQNFNWRIPFGTAEPLQNAQLTVTLPEGFEVAQRDENNLIYDSDVLVYFSVEKNPDYGVANARANGGYITDSSTNTGSPESEQHRKKWNNVIVSTNSAGQTTVTGDIGRFDAGEHSVLQIEVTPKADFVLGPVSTLKVNITADRACAIDGRAFNDTDADGVWDAGELPRPGVPVYLINAAGEIVQQTVTNHTGQYRFGEVDMDTYTVHFERPEALPGYIFTQGPDSHVNAEGVTDPMTFDNDTPQFGTDREFRGVNAGIARVEGQPSYDDSYTSPGTPVEVNQTGDPFVPAGSEYSIDEGTVPAGWTVEIDKNTGRLTVTPPADAQPRENHEIGVVITLPNGDVYAETTARVEVDARIVRFYINDDGDLIVVWNYNGSDGQPYEENLGNVKGEPGAPGQDGISIVKTEIINGELWITYSDGREENVGKVIGEDGKDGIDGSSAIVAGSSALLTGSSALLGSSVDDEGDESSSFPGSSADGTGQGGSSDARCVQAAATVGIPLLALLPIGLATQVNIPGLSPLVANAQAQLQSFNTDIQQQSGIHDPNTANFMAQVNAELQKHGATVGQAVGAAALLTIGGLVGKYLYDSCVPRG